MKSLQLPKNKFIRAAINAAFVAIWWLLTPTIAIYPSSYTFYFFADILKFQNIELVSLLQNLSILIVLILPILLVTKYIWFPKRPKLTRSKD